MTRHSQTATLALFAATLRFEDLPAPVVDHARLCFRDALGCCLFGMTQAWTRLLVDQSIEEGGNPRAGILGTRLRTSIAQAATIGATAGHGCELDDIHGVAHLHAGSLAVPIVLALAELLPTCSGQDMITALVAGYEVGLRVGLAATGAVVTRGHHVQATCGVFVAAAAAARMLNLPPVQTRHAMGIAGSLAAGLTPAQDGAMVKRLQAGHAAQMGVTGAMLAARGFTGSPNILEAEHGGFLSTLSGAPKLDWLTRGLKQDWEILNVGFKPYATAASLHTPLALLDTLMQAHGVAAGDIERIEVRCSAMAHRQCASPDHPAGIGAAQSSLPFALAMMAVDRAAMGEQFREDRLADPAVLTMFHRVVVVPDEVFSCGGDVTRHAARLRLETLSGEAYEAELWDRPGSPANPMSEAQLAAKFRTLAASVLPPSSVAALDSLTANLPQEDFASLRLRLFP